MTSELEVRRMVSKIPGKPLHYLGDEKILAGRSVALIGSRKASPAALALARRLTSELAEFGYTIVSGLARGIDRECHQAALEAGGKTICVLAEGLDGFCVPREMIACWDWHRALVVSEFPMEASWTSNQALARNQTIIDLSDAVIAVTAELASGSMNTIRKTLKSGKPLFAPVFKNQPSGNAAALEMGARAIYSLRTGGPNLKEFFETVRALKPADN